MQSFVKALALLLLVACTQHSSTATAQIQATKPLKEIPMSTIETEKFTWYSQVSNYNVDSGSTKIRTLLPENWFKDAAGKTVRQFYGSSGMWGVGSAGIGGGEVVSALPKTFRLSYYDYIENAFYELEAELDQKRLYELFKQKSFNLSWADKPFITQRFDTIIFGIAPRGGVMVWVVGGAGDDQLELSAHQAKKRTDMTVEKYNARKPAFEIRDDRDYYMRAANGLTEETMQRIKAGLLPLPDYYMKTQRTKYPYRYAMSGNSTLVEFKDRQGNAEQQTVWPYELAKVQSTPMLRGAPREVQLFFTTKNGARHSVYVEFFMRERVNSEPDLTEVWKVMAKMFPVRSLETNNQVPTEADMATLNIHVSDDLKTFTATLSKGGLSIPMQIAPNPQVLNLEPTAHFPRIKPYGKEQLKLLLEGPGDSPVGGRLLLGK